MASSPLVSAAELRTLMSEGGPLVVLDASFELTDVEAGERSFEQGHVPGAQYVHLDRDLCGEKTGLNGRHPLPQREKFAATAGRLGIAPGTHVVTLDRQGGPYAARAWWLLRWLGHEAVAVLDGGMAAWVQADGAVEVSVQARQAMPIYPARTPLVDTIEANGVLKRLGLLRLIDARAPERFRGEVEPLDAQAGHIPGARNRFFKDNLAGDGTFRPAGELRSAFEAGVAVRDPARVGHYCGSGVTACHNLLAMEIAGLHGSLLYPGSWSEWLADPSRPLARG